MPDPALHDEQLEREIQLVGELVLAASQSEEHLTDERIDQILGVDGASPTARSEADRGEADSGESDSDGV